MTAVWTAATSGVQMAPTKACLTAKWSAVLKVVHWVWRMERMMETRKAVLMALHWVACLADLSDHQSVRLRADCLAAMLTSWLALLTEHQWAVLMADRMDGKSARSQVSPMGGWWA